MRSTRVSGRRRAMLALVALVSVVSPVSAVRKCCSEGDEVLVARAAAAEMQCVRGQRLSAAVWAGGEAGAPAGPPPACAGAAVVSVWVLSADAAAAGADEATLPPVEQPPAWWWLDERHFCVEAVQLADRRNNLTARAVAVGCLPQRKGGTEDAGAGASNATDSASGSGSGSGSGMAEGTEVLLSAPAPPPEPLWTGGEMMWVDVVNGVPEPESSAPWSQPPPPAPGTPPASAEAQGAVVRVAASGGGAAELRKCCPRGFALSLEKRTCVRLPGPSLPFPDAHTLRIAPRAPGRDGGLVALLVGPAESLDGWDGPSSLACPPDTARTFQVVSHVEVQAVEVAPDAANFSSASEGSTMAALPEAAAQACVEALAGAGPGAGPGVVVARCAARGAACGGEGWGRAAGDASGGAACVSKCCPLGHSFVGKRCVRSDAALQLDFKTSFAESAAPAHLALIERKPQCDEGIHLLEPSKYPDDSWHLQRDGRVFRPVFSKMYTLDGYCVEHANTSLSTGLVLGVHAFICMRTHRMGETKAG